MCSSDLPEAIGAATVSRQEERAEARAAGEAPPSCGGWQLSIDKNAWFQTLESGVMLVVTKQELLSWEKTQRTPDGKDALRGVKLKARLDGVIASRTPGDVVHVEPVADATGTP